MRLDMAQNFGTVCVFLRVRAIIHGSTPQLSGSFFPLFAKLVSNTRVLIQSFAQIFENLIGCCR